MKARKAIIAIPFIAIPVLLVAVAMRDPSPLRVGSTPDEVWGYMHTGGVSGISRRNTFGVARANYWTAYATNIHCETRFRWQTNKVFAIRKTIYDFGTNDTIQRVQSGWNFNWPF